MTTLLKYILGGIAAVATIIEIAPIKISPWTWLVRWLGRALNHDINEKVDSIARSVEKISSDIDEREAINARIRILRFGDECRIGIRHSKDYFDQIETDITTYEHYCANHPNFKNNMTVITAEYINKIFARCLETNDFL